MDPLFIELLEEECLPFMFSYLDGKQVKTMGSREAAKLNKKEEKILKMNENKPEEKKVNLIVPMETSSNKLNLDTVNSSLDLTVRNARALGISKADLLLMVEESFDRLESKS